MSKVARFARYIAAALVSGALALFFISHVMAPLWRALRGSNLTVKSWRFPIPKGYSQLGDNSLFTFSFGAPFLNDEYGQISLFARPATSDLSPQRLEYAVVTAAQADGYVLEERRTVPTSYGAHYCFHFADKSNGARVAVRCVMESFEVSVYYEGDRRYSRDVYEVLSGLQRVKR